MPTLDEILAKKTPNGGWTKKDLESWGIAWPPQKGWIKELLKENTNGRQTN
jgi:hypothetical protein